jgi:hypothetical protein
VYNVSNADSGDDTDEAKQRYCLWSEIMPYVLPLIKAGKPEYLKIIFCVSGDNALKINENARALFASVKYEKGAVTLLTGTAQKAFSLDKELDKCWDEHMRVILSDNGFEAAESDD